MNTPFTHPHEFALPHNRYLYRTHSRNLHTPFSPSLGFTSSLPLIPSSSLSLSPSPSTLATTELTKSALLASNSRNAFFSAAKTHLLGPTLSKLGKGGEKSPFIGFFGGENAEMRCLAGVRSARCRVEDGGCGFCKHDCGQWDCDGGEGCTHLPPSSRPEWQTMTQEEQKKEELMWKVGTMGWCVVKIDLWKLKGIKERKGKVVAWKVEDLRRELKNGVGDERWDAWGSSGGEGEWLVAGEVEREAIVGVEGVGEIYEKREEMLIEMGVLREMTREEEIKEDIGRAVERWEL